MREMIKYCYQKLKAVNMTSWTRNTLLYILRLCRSFVSASKVAYIFNLSAVIAYKTVVLYEKCVQKSTKI